MWDLGERLKAWSRSESGMCVWSMIGSLTQTSRTRVGLELDQSGTRVGPEWDSSGTTVGLECE